MFTFFFLHPGANKLVIQKRHQPLNLIEIHYSNVGSQVLPMKNDTTVLVDIRVFRGEARNVRPEEPKADRRGIIMLRYINLPLFQWWLVHMILLPPHFFRYA